MSRLTVWTDGCSNNTTQGWAVICPEKKIILRGNVEGATNQQMELGAAIQALSYFGQNIQIITDSKYVIGCYSQWFRNWIRNGWKNAKGLPVENQSLIKLGLQLGADKAIYQHVKGHSGDYNNELADYYCKGSSVKTEHADWILVDS
jgi:ribonuclease HI